MVQKEILVFLITHNLVRWLMAQAANHGNANLDTISFKGSLDAFQEWSQALAQRRQRHRRADLWRKLLATLVADALPFRPGRLEPRAVKKRSKYPHLNRPRNQFQARWARNKRCRNATAKRKCSLN